ncbi:glutamate--tRNA ligase 1 [Rickettsiales bacterium]|nr:glutamate--tRNA ligase 1 [Rickettsiales bacterium]
MLRIDDTDQQRCSKEYEDQILRDLERLRLDYDIFARQSEHLENYNRAIAQLKEQNRLYPCYETPEELELKRREQLSRGLPPIYDRAALKMQVPRDNREPHWRFKINTEEEICWHDLIKGPIKFLAKNLGDPIIIRTNGTLTYMLPSVVDDIEFGVTHIIRGEDHLTNTAIQIQLSQALQSASRMEFAHLPLMHHQGKISKRLGDLAISSLLEQEIEPMTISSYLAKIGTSDNIKPYFNMDELIKNFDITKFSKATTLFDIDKLRLLNKEFLHNLDFKHAKSRLKSMQIEDEDFWYAVRGNIEKFSDAKKWREICKEKIAPIIEDKEFIETAKALFPEGEVDKNTWDVWTKSLQAKTQRKGRGLFLPLRQAITGQEQGPELARMLPLIGKEKILSRLTGKYS